MTQPVDVTTAVLDVGVHDSPDEGGCLLEWISYVANEPWSDHPACVSPVIAVFLRSWNDSLGNADRQQLKRYLSTVIGTNTGPHDEEARAWLCLDWLVRTYTPVWLYLAGLDHEAARLEQLPECRAGTDISSLRPSIDAACKKAAHAWDHAWGAPRDASTEAARDAGWLATRAAARATARDAAWDGVASLPGPERYAARGAARDAARDAAWEAAWVATRTAARAAAHHAARETGQADRGLYHAPWDGARDFVWAAARDAAWVVLRPAVEQLQPAAFLLVDRMIRVGPTG